MSADRWISLARKRFPGFPIFCHLGPFAVIFDGQPAPEPALDFLKIIQTRTITREVSG